MVEEEALELMVITGLDTICERFDVNPSTVLLLMIQEGLVDVEEFEAEADS